MTDQEAAALALQFMERSNLTGAEVPAYSQVQAWLQRMADPVTIEEPEFQHAQPTMAPEAALTAPVRRSVRTV